MERPKQTLAVFLVGVDFTATAFAACTAGLPALFVLPIVISLSVIIESSEHWRQRKLP